MKNEWLFAQTYWGLLRKKQLQQKFLSNYIEGEFSHSFDQFSPSLQFKINYYASWGIVAISEVFATLFERPLTEKERLQSTELSILFALADQLIDQEGWKIDSIDQLLTPISSDSPTFQLAYKILLKYKKEDNIWPTLKQAIKAQSSSHEQKYCADIKKVRSLTYDKGSCTMLIYRSLLTEHLSEKEANTINQLGYCLQLADDLLDVFDDTAEEISTTANLVELEKVVAHYREQVRKGQQLFFKTYQSRGKAAKAFRTFQVLFAISEMAIERYDNNSIKTFNGITLSNLKRSHFIIDMEKVSTVLQSLYYCVRQ